jgi:tetratricopeptide (TPR) repeat protein
MDVNKAAVAVLCLALSCAAPAQMDKTTIRHHREAVVDPLARDLAAAEAKIAAQDLPGAETALLTISKAHPDDYRVWYDLGYVYSATKRKPQAIAAYKKSVALKADVFESNLNLGALLAQAGDPDAEKYLHAATTLKPVSDPDAGRARAWEAYATWLRQNRPAEAVAAYRELLKLEPKNAEAHLVLGELLANQKEFPGAETELKQATTLDPKLAPAWAALTSVYLHEKNYADGEAALRRYLQQDPQNASAHLQLARLLAAEGKTDDAVTEAQLGAKGGVPDAATARQIASIYYSAGRYDDAAALYRQLVTQQPRDPELHYAYGQTLMSSKHFPEAQDEFVKAVSLQPDLVEAYGNLAVVANENKNYPLVLKALDVRSRYMAEDAPSYFLRATALDNLKDFRDAAINYRRFLAAAGDKYPDQSWQAKHRLIAIDPDNKTK